MRVVETESQSYANPYPNEKGIIRNVRVMDAALVNGNGEREEGES